MVTSRPHSTKELNLLDNESYFHTHQSKIYFIQLYYLMHKVCNKVASKSPLVSLSSLFCVFISK